MNLETWLLFSGAALVVILIPAARRLEPSAFAQTVIRALRLELDLRFEAAGAAELPILAMAQRLKAASPSVRLERLT